MNPDKLFGAAFQPLVSIAVAIVLFDGGLDLVRGEIGGEDRGVTRRRELLTITKSIAAVTTLPTAQSDRHSLHHSCTPLGAVGRSQAPIMWSWRLGQETREVARG